MTQSSSDSSERSDYWESYYARAGGGKRPLPSQFAAFVASEMDTPRRVIELGCGAGRDSIFFSLYGHEVIGLDASEQAVKHSTELAAALQSKARFQVATVDDPDLQDRFPPVECRTLVYARFFLHAITSEEERALLRFASSVTVADDELAVEYRTVRDSSGVKVTDAHYRRFVEPAIFQARAIEFGFDVTYAVEGYGFAKYKQDDAYVARTILKRR